MRHAGMLQLARSHMGIKEDERLKLYSEDGFQFMQNAGSQSYDVVIVDVAAPDLVRYATSANNSVCAWARRCRVPCMYASDR